MPSNTVAMQLRVLQPHGFDGLIDHELLHHELIDRHGRDTLGKRLDFSVETAPAAPP